MQQWCLKYAKLFVFESPYSKLTFILLLFNYCKWKNFHLCSIFNLLTSTCRINPKDIKLHNFNWQCILSILKSTIPLLISFSWFSFFFFSSRRRRVYGRKWLRRRSRMLEHCRGLHLYLHNKGIQRIWEGMYRRVVLLYTKNIGWMNEHLPLPWPNIDTLNCLLLH